MATVVKHYECFAPGHPLQRVVSDDSGRARKAYAIWRMRTHHGHARNGSRRRLADFILSALVLCALVLVYLTKGKRE